MRMMAGSIAFACLASLAATASAEEFNLGNRPWDFTQQNRAGIAAMMVQKRNGTLGGLNGTGGVGGGNACGGNGGSSTAIGNYTCIILNDSTAAIEQLQKELGDQTANAQAQSVTNGNMSDAIQDLTN
jgi:hypothetical protein